MSRQPCVAILILLASLFCQATDADAQRVHLLVAGDTLDQNIGKSVDSDLDNIVATFFILLRDGQLEHARLAGDAVSAENVLKAIQRFRVMPDEAMVFYWAGHGAYDKLGPYLQMPRGGSLYRSTLLGAMKRKQARLTVLLTDCCNVYSDATAGMPRVAPASPDPRRKTSPLFDELFCKSRGVVDVNAAAQGEVALGTKDGGLFTLSLAYIMPGKKLADEKADESGIEEAFGVFWRDSQKRSSWQAVIQASRGQVQELFAQLNPNGLIARDGRAYHKQTVVAWSLPEPPRPQPPVDRGSRFGVDAVDNGGQGVRVVRVWPDYPGTQATEVGGNRLIPLQPGDVILSINGRRIGGTKDYWDAVKGSPLMMQFTIREIRDGQRRNLRVKLRY
jgi:hypothetical protein